MRSSATSLETSERTPQQSFDIVSYRLRRAFAAWTPVAIDLPVVVYRATGSAVNPVVPPNPEPVAKFARRITVVPVPGTHATHDGMMTHQHAVSLADRMQSDMGGVE